MFECDLRLALADLKANSKTALRIQCKSVDWEKKVRKKARTHMAMAKMDNRRVGGVNIEKRLEKIDCKTSDVMSCCGLFFSDHLAISFTDESMFFSRFRLSLIIGNCVIKMDFTFL